MLVAPAFASTVASGLHDCMPDFRKAYDAGLGQGQAPDVRARDLVRTFFALANADGATLRRVAVSLVTQLDATDDASQARYFSHGYHGDCPSRAGYYVGLLAARQLGATMTLQQMAALPTARVRELLEQTLRSMAASLD